MPLPITDVIDIRIEQRPGLAARPRFGQILALITDNPQYGLSYGGAGKVRTFGDASEVNDVFGASGQPFRFASAVFSQTPSPPTLYLGLRATADQPHRILGGSPAAASAIASSNVTDGSLTVGSASVTAIQFASGATYAAIATAVQTRVAAAFTGATCVYSEDDNRFVVTIPNTVTTVNAPATAGAAGTDLATQLGLTSAAGARFIEGADAETVAEALHAISRVNDGWDAVVSETDGVDVAAWATANRKFAWVQDSTAGALVAGEATSDSAKIFATGTSRAAVTWHDHPASVENVAAAVAAKFAAADYNRSNSMIQAKFLKLVGISGAEITRAQKAELNRKRTNVYASYGLASFYAEGMTPSTDRNGAWIDVVYFMDWLREESIVALLDYLQSDDHIPQSDETSAGVRDALNGVLRRGVDAGAILPGGLVDPAVAARIRAAGVEDFNGRLSSGYMVLIPSFDTLSPSELAARKMPPIGIYFKGSGAVNFIDGDLTIIT